jgi:serine protease inhibitor ecotin
MLFIQCIVLAIVCIPTSTHKLYKITSYPQTQTLLHVSATNRHPQGDASTKEYIILLHQILQINVNMHNNVIFRPTTGYEGLEEK